MLFNQVVKILPELTNVGVAVEAFDDELNVLKST
jgi:hypothetical protein